MGSELESSAKIGKSGTFSYLLFMGIQWQYTGNILMVYTSL